MNAEGFAVRGALVADSSLCPSHLFRKDLRTRNTTSIVTTRNATPSPAAIIQRCCALFPVCSAVSIPRVFRLLLLFLSASAPRRLPRPVRGVSALFLFYSLLFLLSFFPHFNLLTPIPIHKSPPKPH